MERYFTLSQSFASDSCAQHVLCRRLKAALLKDGHVVNGESLICKKAEPRRSKFVTTTQPSSEGMAGALPWPVRYIVITGACYQAAEFLSMIPSQPIARRIWMHIFPNSAR